ncbi:hypothetical protein [Aestuariivirga sp.]|uniref:hypothetical protein n=1 Tax=Aestuariivirga sp. TaxID=2650926 RepID=UPI0039E57E69
MASMNLPDGRVIKFPDGLTYDQVSAIANAAMAEKQPEQQPAAKPVRLQIGERIVEVDRSFLGLSPEEQQKTVDEIDASIRSGKTESTPTPKPVFTIQTPSGRKLTIEAADEATALHGAREWEEQNAGPQQGRPDEINVEFGGGQGRVAPKSNLETKIPPNDIQSGDSKLVHRGKLMGQAVGQGVVGDLLGLPADFKNMVDWATGKAVNAGVAGLNATAVPLVNKAMEAAGVDAQLPDVPYLPDFEQRQVDSRKLGEAAAKDVSDWTGIDKDALAKVANFSMPGGEEIGQMANDSSKALGYEPAVPQSSGERLAYEATRLGSGALSMGGALRSGAKTLEAAGKVAGEMPALVRPYLKSPNRALAGDVAGGVGSATALHALAENAPDQLKESVPLRVLVAALGGHAGNTALKTAASAKSVAQKAGNWMPDSNPLLRDPETGRAPRQRNVSHAAEFLQKRATDPAAAAEAIAKNQNYFEEVGGAMPTSGLISDDLGLQMVEKAFRNADPLSFAERDKALRSSAAQDVAATRPEGANPLEARSTATSIRNEALRTANYSKRTAEANAAAADASERQLAQDYQPYAGVGPTASEDLDRVLVDSVLKPLQDRKNQLFEGIDPSGTVQRDLAPISDLAKVLLDNAKGQPDAVRQQMLPESLLKDFIAKAEKGDTMSFRDLNDTRAAISGMERQATANSQFPLARNLGQLKSAISDDARTLASEGSDAGDRALEAMRFYQEEFAPLFARGEGGEFRKDFNRDNFRTKTPPTATAGRFLRDGPGGKEAAASLQKILAASPKGAEGADAARRYVLSDMAKAVGADGKISETALRRWISNRSGMLSQVPEIEKEVKGVLDEVVSRSAKTGQMRMQVENAAASLNRTQRDMDKSALSLLIDTDPKRAAEAVLNSKDPVGAAVQLRKAFDGNVPAERGWKAAVSDYLVEQLGSSGKAGISDDLDAVSLEKINTLFRKNEAALRTIFGDDVRYLNQARRRLEALSNKSVQAAKDSKVPNHSLIRKAIAPLDFIFRLWYGALTGGSMSRKFRGIAENFPDTTEATNQLVRRALLDPEIAKHLLTKPTGHGEIVAWNRRLNQLMGWAEAARGLGQEN